MDDAGTSGGGGSSQDGGWHAGNDAGRLDDGGSTADAGALPCRAVPPPDSQPRKVVVSHPYAFDAGRDDRYEVLLLSPTGELTRTQLEFRMGRGWDGTIVFTPDGEIGLVAQDDGSIGVFRFADGGVEVLHRALKQGFYAHQVLVSADGARAYVLDFNTEANGGGIYALAIGCDGQVRFDGKLAPASGASAMALLPRSTARAVLAAGSVSGLDAGSHAHVLELSDAGVSRLYSGRAFPDDDAIASDVAITADERFAIVADNGFAAGNRIAAVSLENGRVTQGQLFTTGSPRALASSPFNNALLVVSSDGADAYRLLRYEPANAAAPFTLSPSPIAYRFGRPQLPGAAIVVRRGQLLGRVLVAELSGVRQLQFTDGGQIEDVAELSLGSGFEGIVGAIGVTP